MVLREPTGARSSRQQGHIAGDRRWLGPSLTTMNVLPISYTDVSVASTAFFAELYLLSAGNCRTGADS